MPSLVRTLPPPVTLTGEMPDLREDPSSHAIVHSVDKLAEYTPPRRGRKPGKNSYTPGFRLGEYIRSLIELKGYDRQYVADHVGISRSSLDHIVAGYVRQPDIDTILRLAKLLGVSVLDIYAHTDVVTQHDISFFMLGHTGDSAIAKEAAWSSLAVGIAALTPENRRLTLEFFIASLKTMEAFHRLAA